MAITAWRAVAAGMTAVAASEAAEAAEAATTDTVARSGVTALSETAASDANATKRTAWSETVATDANARAGSRAW